MILTSLTACAQGYIFTLKHDIPLPISAQSSISALSPEHGVYAADSYEDISWLVENSLIDILEKDSEYTLFDTYTPEDAYYSEQYYISDIKAPAAWERGIFGEGVKVAVIDSGVSSSASDFSLGGIVYAKDYTDTASSKLDFARDKNGHGTAVAGIIAAEHNFRGIAGVAPKCTLYIFKCFNADKKALNKDIISAIYSACDEYGCDIINMSFGGTESEVFREACDYAASKGVLMVSAAGNDGASSQKLYYPASYDNVISVGSASKTGHRATHSQRNDKVNMMAPGDGIFSLSLAMYSASSGTSFAAPQVTAAAALLMSLYPSLTASDITELLYRSANEMTDRFSGFGSLNIASLFRLADLCIMARENEGTLYYDIADGSAFYSIAAPDSSAFYIADYSDGSLISLLGLSSGKLPEALFDKAKLFLWKRDSLAPLPPPEKIFAGSQTK